MKDIERLKKNCFAVMQNMFADRARAEKALADEMENGCWNDVDYQNQNHSGWRAAEPLYRLRVMAAEWSDPASPYYHSGPMGEGIKRGLEYWCKQDCHCGNWWWNEIFVPMALGNIFILADDLLRRGPWLEMAMPFLLQSRFGMTGQNRIWCAEGGLLRGILTQNEDEIVYAQKEISAEIVYGTIEGIRADGAYHQHGPQLQFGNYGMAYLNTITYMIACFAGTRWALTRIAPFRYYVFNGIKWVLWKDVMDLLAQGRQVGKDTQNSKNLTCRNAIAKLAKCDPRFAAEYRKEPVGNRMFFNTDYMVHRTRQFYASCRANSIRTAPVETFINRDNLLGRYLSDGAMLVMRSGNEYLNIAGCWSWTRLPGTTTPDTPRFTQEESRKHGFRTTSKEIPLATHCAYRREIGTTAFTGGVSDGGKYGVMVYTMDVDDVKAKKAVFFAGNIIVALGSGIRSDSPYPVATTVEQSLLNGDVVSGDGWFHHNGIGYSGSDLRLWTGTRIGDWAPTNGCYNEPVPDKKAIFQLTIEHGTGFRDAGYEYAIYPTVTAEEMPRAIQSYQVLANNESLQAVKLKDRTILAVFHKPGSLGDFSTDAPGVFILRKKQIHAADPTQKKRLFHIKWKGIGHTVKLPRGARAGSTVLLQPEDRKD